MGKGKAMSQLGGGIGTPDRAKRSSRRTGGGFRRASTT